MWGYGTRCSILYSALYNLKSTVLTWKSLYVCSLLYGEPYGLLGGQPTQHRGKDPFPLPTPWPFSKTGKGYCECQRQHFNWMGFIINVSLSEDFCLICFSRPFGRNCRGTEGEQHVVVGRRRELPWRCQLLCLKVAVFFKFLKEIWAVL